MYTSTINEIDYRYFYLEVILKEPMDVNNITLHLGGADLPVNASKYFGENPRIWMSANGELSGTPCFTGIENFIVNRTIYVPYAEQDHMPIPHDFDVDVINCDYFDIYWLTNATYQHGNFVEITVNDVSNIVEIPVNTDVDTFYWTTGDSGKWETSKILTKKLTIINCVRTNGCKSKRFIISLI